MFDDLFTEPFLPGLRIENRKIGCEIPPVNIHESDKEFLFEMAAPGLKKEDFTIDLEKDNITISCNKETETEKTEEKYTKREFDFFQFQRVFTLPESVDASKIKANYENGILKIHLPKKTVGVEKTKREIKIS
jgi:HSP20 family protein